MFHQRSSAFEPDLAAIEGRLRALENDLERVARKAGRRISARSSAAGDQIGDAVAAPVSQIVDQIRRGKRVAGDEAVRFGNEAAKIGSRLGNDALDRIVRETEYRPLAAHAVAIGIGILIGMVGRRH
jgi:ElaB/YqjD/DUF883 family membrane-anchored ribosome-binding protein